MYLENPFSLMTFPSLSPPLFSFCLSTQSSIILSMESEMINAKIKHQQQALRRNSNKQFVKQLDMKIKQMQLKVSILQSQNNRLRSLIKPKRPYSKRRINLQKKFMCPIQKCSCSYSSIIALKNHMKKKHHSEQEIQAD